jgi:hypothetical protein
MVPPSVSASLYVIAASVVSNSMHQAELMQNWTTLAEEGNFRRIAPLV